MKLLGSLKTQALHANYKVWAVVWCRLPLVHFCTFTNLARKKHKDRWMCEKIICRLVMFLGLHGSNSSSPTTPHTYTSWKEREGKKKGARNRGSQSVTRMTSQPASTENSLNKGVPTSPPCCTGTHRESKWERERAVLKQMTLISPDSKSESHFKKFTCAPACTRTHTWMHFSCISIVTTSAPPAWGGNAKLGASEPPSCCSFLMLRQEKQQLSLLLSLHCLPSVHSALFLFPRFPSPFHISLSLSPPPWPVSDKFIEVDNRGKSSLLFSLQRCVQFQVGSVLRLCSNNRRSGFGLQENQRSVLFLTGTLESTVCVWTDCHVWPQVVFQFTYLGNNQAVCVCVCVYGGVGWECSSVCVHVSIEAAVVFIWFDFSMTLSDGVLHLYFLFQRVNMEALFHGVCFVWRSCFICKQLKPNDSLERTGAQTTLPRDSTFKWSMAVCRQTH